MTRIAVGAFLHETNTFAPIKATYADFEHGGGWPAMSSGRDVPKVMRRINNRPVAVEAVLTRCGTIVGPYMSELIGYKRLTPARGGWCGNEMFPEVLIGESRRTATQLVRRLGDRNSRSV